MTVYVLTLLYYGYSNNLLIGLVDCMNYHWHINIQKKFISLKTLYQVTRSVNTIEGQFSL